MRNYLVTTARALLRRADSLDWLAPLAMRLVFGYFWLETGLGKLHNLAGFTERFADWGIPFPHLSAALSAATDCVGGTLLMVGLFTRLVTIPMIVNMIVAIAVVAIKPVTDLDDFVELNEVLYILVLFWLMMAGPGRVSLDTLVARALGFGQHRTP
jgi:putative oxidoreductase